MLLQATEFAWKDINIPPESTSRRVASLRLDDARKLLERREELSRAGSCGVAASFSISLTGALVRSNKASRVHTLLPQLTGALLRSYIHGMARERLSLVTSTKAFGQLLRLTLTL